GTDWGALFDAGFVAEPEVEIRYVPWGDDGMANEYTSSEGHERRQLAASNPAKADEVAAIIREHPGQKALVFVEYLEQGDRLAEELEVPFISGRTPHAERGRRFEEFRAGDRSVLIVSRVGDEGLDLPSAEVAIAASGLGGSRRQGAQRAGRTMRPVGRALLYVLATRGTREEEFARRRMRHLAGKGIRVREAPAVTGE
ncbi:MAG: helicase-related protein, partial [Halobacteriales archaeon]